VVADAAGRYTLVAGYADSLNALSNASISLAPAVEPLVQTSASIVETGADQSEQMNTTQVFGGFAVAGESSTVSIQSVRATLFTSTGFVFDDADPGDLDDNSVTDLVG